MTLVDFLRARIAEDEATARGLSNWRALEAPLFHLYDDDAEAQADFDSKDHAKTLAHLLDAHHVPARLLAECEAKRRTIEAARANVKAWAFERADTPADDAQLDRWCDDDDVLQAMATAWVDHPDYRPEWTPVRPS